MPEQDPDVTGAIEMFSKHLAARLVPYVGEPITEEQKERITKDLLAEVREHLQGLNLGCIEVVAAESGPDKIAFRFEIPAWMVPEAPEGPDPYNPED
jgi:hypothetical protein